MAAVAAVQNPPAEKLPATLVEKLAAVMAAVERVPKTGWNDFHKYHYATEADLSDAVRANMARYGVMLIPSVEKMEWREVATKNGTEKIATLTVRFTATDGKDKVEFFIIGEGQDRGDKATYKAMTGATKYALLKLFLIPTGDDPEKEEDEHPHTGSRAAPQKAAAKSTPPPSPASAAPAPLYVTALWNKVKAKVGEEKARDPAKTREAFKAGAFNALGPDAPASNTWTVEQTAKVEAAIFGPDDIAF